MKKAFTFLIAAFLTATTFAQLSVNRLAPTIIEDTSSFIGFLPEFRFTGLGSHNTTAAMGMLNDYSTGNYLFFGSADDSARAASSTGQWPGLYFYPSYNQAEFTSPVLFLNQLKIKDYKIGLFGGAKEGVIPIQATPASSTDENENLSPICFDENFLYIKTPSGRWKRVALLDINFNW